MVKKKSTKEKKKKLGLKIIKKFKLKKKRVTDSNVNDN